MDESSLDRDWHTGTLLRFVFPTIAMMLFMGLYTLVDTIFVAQFVHTDALSAVNIVCPVVNITVGLGTMLAAGGNAVISRKMGAGHMQEAREDFTLLVLAGLGVGGMVFLGGTIWVDRIIYSLGASSRLFSYCKEYLAVLLLFMPANVLQTMFSNLFVTAGKPELGFGLSAAAGIANIVLDYIFIVLCGLGVKGAALGTGFGYLIPAVAGGIFFVRKSGPLYFTRPKWKGKVIVESCWNGSSEMVGQMAAAVTTFLFNRTMMELLGEDGVAAITIVIYTQFLLNTLFIGFSMGVAPVIGFYYGSQNSAGQKKVFQISVRFITAVSVLMFIASLAGGPCMVRLFAEETTQVYTIAAEGFELFSYSFLFCGLNIFTSAMFTALSNGKVSAALSFLRTFGLMAGGILLLPKLWGSIGIWLAVPAAEGISFILSILCLLYYRKEYSY